MNKRVFLLLDYRDQLLKMVLLKQNRQLLTFEAGVY
jgi:hypothetical protein